MHSQARQPNNLDLQYALLNNQDATSIIAGANDPFAALAQFPLSAPSSKRGPQRQRRNEEQIRRTVYISDVDHAVSEHELAIFFQHCGPIVDCRVCGDANSAMRFAFIEFRSESGARAALGRSGATLGTAVIRVSPSKTAIVPVNNQYLPRSEEERAAVARTVYVANIHRAVERDALHAFFLNLCGTVSKIRLLGDAQHDTKIAFVEFATSESAAAALRCTGALLGPLPIRVSASKTPVRTEGRRSKEPSMGQMHSGQLQANGSQVLARGLQPSHSMPQIYGDNPMMAVNTTLTSTPSLPSALLFPPGVNFSL